MSLFLFVLDHSAAVVKITLDRGRLLPDYSSPYIPEARRRKSFDSSNSMSLASHLLKGGSTANFTGDTVDLFGLAPFFYLHFSLFSNMV